MMPWLSNSAVSLRDGIAIDAQFLGQRAERWQRLAWTQSTGSRRIADLVCQLEINWLARLEINLGKS